MKNVKNSIDFKLVKEDNESYKEASVFRTLEFLNKKSKIVKAAKLEKLTIDDLKLLCPDYFTIVITDKKTKEQKIENRKLFSPWVFLTAIRNKYGKI